MSKDAAMSEDAAKKRLASHLGSRLHEFIASAREIPALEQNTREAIANDRAMCRALHIDWESVAQSCRMMPGCTWPEHAWLDA